MDLDKSGHGFQRVRTYLGPSLGWTEEYVQPTTEIRAGGTYVVQAGDSIILVNVAASVTIQLPDVREWMQQNANQPATGFDRSITVKDFGRNSANFNIIVTPFGQQGIDTIQASIVVSQAGAAIKLIPLVDMTGWAVALASTSGSGPGGGGDVFKAGNNTFTGANNFLGQIVVPLQSNGDDTANAASTEWVQNQAYITNTQATAAFQPLDADLTSLASQTAVDSMFYRSGTNTWSQVVIGANLVFAGGTLTATGGGGGGGAPIGAEYITSSPDATLSAERVLTDSATVTWDRTSPGQIKAITIAGGGNVSNSGVPTINQIAQWVTSTTIKGVDLSTLGFQPLDADLTALSGLTGTNTIYYRSAPDIWSPVTFSGITFSGGVLTAASSGGNVSNSGTPANGQVARWVDSTHIEGVAPSALGLPKYTGSATAPVTPGAGDFWYDLSTGVLSIYVNDGNTSQWIQVSPGGGGSGGSAGFTTGDAKLTFKTAADVGWILCNDGSIGNGASGATTRANADTVDLFTLFYINVPSLILQDNTGATVGRGASAASDFGANRRLVIPKTLGRSIAGAGAGSGLTNRNLGTNAGAESVSQTTAQLATHTHFAYTTYIYPTFEGNAGLLQNGSGLPYDNVNLVSVNNAGTGDPMPIVDPSIFMNVMVKL